MIDTVGPSVRTNKTFKFGKNESVYILNEKMVILLTFDKYVYVETDGEGNEATLKVMFNHTDGNVEKTFTYDSTVQNDMYDTSNYENSSGKMYNGIAFSYVVQENDIAESITIKDASSLTMNGTVIKDIVNNDVVSSTYTDVAIYDYDDSETAPTVTVDTDIIELTKIGPVTVNSSDVAVRINISTHPQSVDFIVVKRE